VLLDDAFLMRDAKKSMAAWAAAMLESWQFVVIDDAINIHQS
jgi:hypothetical protein